MEPVSGPTSYETVIGLEVHAQLQTRSKAFAPVTTEFGGAPNTQLTPLCIGHPGTLPVLNENHVRFTVKMGLATNCAIAPRSIFARKNYFYPDLPKGYQISQYETPICANGWVDIELDGGRTKRIRINRIHMEEDAGKSIHDQDPYHTLIDLNRAGTPLIEIVTEPDISSPAEAYAYLTKIRQIVRYLEICDGNMEEGSLRCDANVSIRPVGAEKLGTRTEIKNLNSFRNVERAIAYEVKRQAKVLDAGGKVVQTTLLWDANKLETRELRSKEEAHDYRYFPEPDIPPVIVTEAMMADIRAELPEMPEERRKLFREYEFDNSQIEALVENKAIGDIVAAIIRVNDIDINKLESDLRSMFTLRTGTSEPLEFYKSSNFNRILNISSVNRSQLDFLLSDIDSALEFFRDVKSKDIVKTSGNIATNNLANYTNINAVAESEIKKMSWQFTFATGSAAVAKDSGIGSSNTVANVTNSVYGKLQAVEPVTIGETFVTSIIRASGNVQVSDTGFLEPLVDGVIAANPDKVAAYNSGKDGLLGFFVGQVMRSSQGKANPQMVSEMVVRKLKERA